MFKKDILNGKNFTIKNFVSVMFILMKYLSLFILIYFFVTFTYPQTKSRKKAPPIVKTQSELYNNESFDSTVSQLPPYFNGNDIRQIFKSVKIPHKSEFETSDQYNARIENFTNKNLVEKITPKSTIAFSFSNEWNFLFSKVETLYNADTKKLKVSINGSNFSIFAPLSSSQIAPTVAVEIRSITSNLGSYLGSNAYGVKKRVSKINQEIYLIAFDNCKKNLSNEESIIITDGFDTEITVDVKDAIDLKGNIALLYIGNLKSPYWEENSGLIAGAKVTNPTEIRGDYKTIYLDLKSIWIYSKKTGKVYSKLQKCSAGRSNERSYYHFFF